MKNKRFLFLAFIFCLVFSFSTGFAQTTESYVWKSVAIRGGGFVPGLVFSTVAKGMLYARTDMGTAYRWDDSHGSWIPLMDWLTRAQMQYIGVEGIAPDPVDSNTVYMAVGTYVGPNGAIIKSTDRGATWTFETIGATMGGNADGRSFGNRLTVDPNNNSIIYFGSRTTGLWKSANAGGAWANVASFPVKGTSPYGLTFVVFDKTSGTSGAGSSIIYVGVATSNAAGTNLYRSKDAGVTWTLVAGTNAPTGLEPNHGVIASDGNMWIAYTNGPGPSNASTGSVWKLNTATDAWTNVDPAGHGGGIGGISVSATDPNYAICTTIDWWNPDEIYRTTNGGTSWTGIGKSAQHNMLGAYYLCFGPPTCASPSSNGWDADIQIDPFNEARAFHTTGQGVWCSTNADNATATQVVWSFTDNNFEETVGMSLTSSVKKSLFACLGDIGIQRFPTDSLDTPSVHGIVSNLGSGNGNYVDFAALNPNIVIDCGAGGAGYSTDNGITWKNFTSKPASANMAVSADGSIFVVGSSYSTNNGTSWTACSGVSGGRIASDRVNPKKFYAFTGGTLYASTDGAATFTAATTGLSGSGRAAAVPGMEGEVWVAAGNNLYHSKTSGTSATRVTTVSSVTSVGFGKAAPTATYPAVYIIGTVGSVTGVFRSNDQGTTWVRVNDDQHQYGEMDNVAGDEDYYGRVFVTTQGRGIPYGQPGTAQSVVKTQVVSQLPASILKFTGTKVSALTTNSMQLLDLNGRMIRQAMPVRGRVEIDLKDLSKGAYIARCGNDALFIGLAN